MTLATAGPGGNQQLAAGRRRQVPAAGRDSDARAKPPTLWPACRRSRLLHLYELMSTSRKWETTMKDLFLGGQGRSLRRVPHLRRRGSDRRRRDRRAERRRLHRQHASRPRPSDRQGRRSQQDVGRDLLQGDRLQQGLRRLDAHHRHVQGHHGHERHRRRQLLHGRRRGDARAWCAAPSRWRSRSSATAPSASPYYFSAVRSCANLKIPAIFVNENNFQYMHVPMALTVADQVHLRVHQGSRHPAPPRRRQRRHGGVRGDEGSGRVGARRQGPEHDRRHHLPLVRPRRLRRRQGRRRTARWACPIAPTTKCGSGCRAIRSRATRSGCWRRALATEAELPKIDARRQAAVDASDRVRAQERRSAIRRPAC